MYHYFSGIGKGFEFGNYHTTNKYFICNVNY